MEEINNKNLDFIVNTIITTIETYKERFPDLRYLAPEIKISLENNKNLDVVKRLEQVCKILEVKTPESYIIRLLHNAVSKDLEILKNSQVINQTRERYWE